MKNKIGSLQKIDKETLLILARVCDLDYKHKAFFDVLDILYSKSKTFSDFELVAEAATIVKYFDLYRKSCETLVSLSRTIEQRKYTISNLISCYLLTNYPEKALKYVELFLSDPKLYIDGKTLTYNEVMLNKAACHSLMNDYDTYFKIIEELTPEDEAEEKNMKYMLSLKKFKENKISEGVYDFNNGKEKVNNFFEENKIPFWDGVIKPGKTLIINGECGMGDEIINIRFLKYVKELGMNPVFYSSFFKERKELGRLFIRHGFPVVTNNLFFDRDCEWTHMMCLAGRLNLKTEQYWYGTYLTPLRSEKNKLPERTKKLRIGIKCNGNPYFEQDVYRKIPIEQMLEALPKDAEIYYFDKDFTHPDTISLKEKLVTWEDTLDYIDQMDIIVSSCTSLVHAAGAMGKKTIVLPPIGKYYVWWSPDGQDKNKTPWYGDNMHVFTQEKLRCWEGPLAKVKKFFEDGMVLK